MIRKILLITLLFLTNNAFSKALGDEAWDKIVRDFVRDADANDRGEFEAAKQAFLNIGDDLMAEDAAGEIQTHWKAAFGIEATAGNPNRSEPGTLLSLKRYPEMKKESAILQATIDLFKKDNINKFLVSEKIVPDLSEAEKRLKELEATGK